MGFDILRTDIIHFIGNQCVPQNKKKSIVSMAFSHYYNS